jgi:hypothetical protein
MALGEGEQVLVNRGSASVLKSSLVVRGSRVLETSRGVRRRASREEGQIT